MGGWSRAAAAEPALRVGRQRCSTTAGCFTASLKGSGAHCSSSSAGRKGLAGPAAGGGSGGGSSNAARRSNRRSVDAQEPAEKAAAPCRGAEGWQQPTSAPQAPAGSATAAAHLDPTALPASANSSSASTPGRHMLGDGLVVAGASLPSLPRPIRLPWPLAAREVHTAGRLRARALAPASAVYRAWAAPLLVGGSERQITRRMQAQGRHEPRSAGCRGAPPPSTAQAVT